MGLAGAVARMGRSIARRVRRLTRRAAAPASAASDDPWRATPQRVPLTRFGAGATREFSWYFEGESLVRVERIDDLCAWLLECEYVRDPELFNERDFWQHPRTFEHLRKGDCEDYAVWAWRKLTEMGYEAELVSGEVLHDGGDASSHVWVLFDADGDRFLLECTARTRPTMVRRLAEVRARYVPHWGITGRLESRGYAGYHVARRRPRAP
jgi:hypothetical protein